MLASSKGLLALGLLAFSVSCAEHGSRQDDGYIGYRLDQRGDPESAVYETANTNTDADNVLPEDPDVYLNASVSVGEIDIEVDNITAKINLQADVLKLLHFSAGVDASIDRVKLTIQNVSAKVELEARLENVVQMVADVLDSIDLNPVIATLGDDLGKIVNGTVGDLTSDDYGAKAKRNFALDEGILYSINDYTGNTHTNRVLAQNGDLYDVKLDNDGDEESRTTVGYYDRDMTFTGHNKTVSIDGEVKEFELQYMYNPFPGIESVCWIYVSPTGKVTRTQVIAETFGGGSSTISDDGVDDL
ncbi:hypothetical protein UCDDA912_g00519 [Diaporthe ampelina]|uniref:Uncharacterized protein n=1 Tax=Diaporthe ampelina TaxID=1214573 RepID=A0A0G2FZE5_9PEZI|nr:hypothetical protein UCDDA912_g00519 [Diaporthe ampelina]